MKTVLFISYHNSVRSQIAEGLVNGLYSRSLRAESAGINPRKVHPSTIKVMAELDIDISNQRSKSLDKFEEKEFDYVVMVCSSAAETCHFFSGGKGQILLNFNDPAEVEGSPLVRIQAFRKTRNQINKWIIDNLVLPKKGR